MIPYSFYADSKVRTFIYKRELHKKLKGLQELGEQMLSYLDSFWIQEELPKFREMDSIYKSKGCGFVDFYSPDYPPLLREIYDPPLVLFIYGNPELLSLEYAAIVGTRKASAISLFATRKLVEYLIQENTHSYPLGIVSGMALGIDKEAMQMSLDCDLPTLGVLGTPAYAEYPYGNLSLYKQMKSTKNTCLVSELLPIDRYAKWTFPKRNRIITGIAKNVYLMETPKQSGAMSSAYNALDQNKEIFVFSDLRQENNMGGQLLINDGAQEFSLDDLNIQGNVKHITEFSHPNKNQSENFYVSHNYANILNNDFDGKIESLGNGYYFIGNS